MDGKHVALRKPIRSGSTFYNYKHTFSIVLLAVVDANYRFIYVDVGCQGRISDGGVFRNSSLFSAIKTNDINIPPPDTLPNLDTHFPYVFVADDAFPLTENLMKPYAKRGLNRKERIFNYRLSRARRLSENAFGILVSRFRVFKSAMEINPDKARNVVLAGVVLHNFLMRNKTAEGQWTECFDETLHMQGLRCSHKNPVVAAKDIRNLFAEYFMNSGQVPWQ